MFLGTDLPIIQAPMAGSQGSALAIAVSNAGGLGSLPCAMLDAQAIRKEMEAIRAQTSKPYNVNFFCHVQPAADEARESAWRSALAPYYREFGIDPAPIAAGPGRLPFSQEVADVLEAFKPAVVSFHFGLPALPPAASRTRRALRRRWPSARPRPRSVPPTSCVPRRRRARCIARVRASAPGYASVTEREQNRN